MYNKTSTRPEHRRLFYKYKLFHEDQHDTMSDTLSILQFQHNGNKLTVLGDRDDPYIKLDGVEIRAKTLAKVNLPRSMDVVEACDWIEAEKEVFVMNCLNGEDGMS